MAGKGARELCLASLKGWSFNGNVPEEAFEAVHQGFMREYPHTWQEGTVPQPRYPGNVAVPGWRRLSSGRFIQQAPCGYSSAGAPCHALEFPFREVMGFSERSPRKPEPDPAPSIVRSWGREPAQACRPMVGDSAHRRQHGRERRNTACSGGVGAAVPVPLWTLSGCRCAPPRGNYLPRLHDESSLPFPVAAHKNSRKFRLGHSSGSRVPRVSSRFFQAQENALRGIL